MGGDGERTAEVRPAEVVMIALVATCVFGVWLFVSAFLLPHGPVTSWNSMLVGLGVCSVGLLAYSMPGRPGVRYANTALAVWLFVAGIVLPHVSGATVFHDMALALALLFVSMVPPGRLGTHGHVGHAGGTGG